VDRTSQATAHTTALETDTKVWLYIAIV